MNIKIGKLPEERWYMYQDLRLEALQKDSIAFSSSFEEEEREFEEVDLSDFIETGILSSNARKIKYWKQIT